MELVKKEIKLKYRRSYLGILWTLIEPLLTTAVLAIVFVNFRSKGTTNFPVYILSGRLLYSYYSIATKAALKSIRSNSSMIKKVYVPKYIYPLSAVLSGYLTFLISLVVLVGVMIFYGVKPTLYIFQAIVPLFIILIMTLGTSMILSTLSVFFRDLEYLWGVVLMLIMYCSAIFYDVEDMLTKNSSNAWVFKWNPLYAVIQNFRNSIFGQPLDQFALVYSLLFSVVTLLFGTWLFYKKQDEFILNI